MNRIRLDTKSDHGNSILAQNLRCGPHRLGSAGRLRDHLPEIHRIKELGEALGFMDLRDSSPQGSGLVAVAASQFHATPRNQLFPRVLASPTSQLPAFVARSKPVERRMSEGHEDAIRPRCLGPKGAHRTLERITKKSVLGGHSDLRVANLALPSQCMSRPQSAPRRRSGCCRCAMRLAC